jgi:hypothetical protein
MSSISAMKLSFGVLFLLALPAVSRAQTTPADIPPSRLQAILDLPLNQSVHQRAIYKVLLKSAYERGDH